MHPDALKNDVEFVDHTKNELMEENEILKRDLEQAKRELQLHKDAQIAWTHQTARLEGKIAGLTEMLQILVDRLGKGQ